MAAEWPQEMGQHPGCDRVSLIEREEPRLGRANQGKKMSTGVVAWPGEWKQRETRHKRKETSCRPLSSSRLITRRAKKYPAVICIYEKLSQGLNGYFAPSARGFNKSVYTSRGYAVLMPDIVYKVNDPGRTAGKRFSLVDLAREALKQNAIYRFRIKAAIFLLVTSISF